MPTSNDDRPRRILVTGGTGFIGSHQCVELLALGYEVVIADNLSNSHPLMLEGIKQISGRSPKFYELDVCDEQALAQLFAQEGPIDGVIHFAAYKAVGESVAEPLKYYHNNLNGLLSLLRCMEAANCNKLVFSSSCTVYGEPESLPVSEAESIKPAESPYGNTKQICEEIIQDHLQSDSNSLSCISLRYFNPVGAHPSALIGELPLGRPNNLMPIITQTGIGKREKMQILGSDYPTPDGTCIRDYIHVMDVADAHIKALERLFDPVVEEKYEVFNLGTGRGQSVQEVVDMFEEVAGQPLNYELAPRRSGDVIQIYADTRKANEGLGWSAKRDLREMVASAWNWEQAYAKRESNG